MPGTTAHALVQIPPISQGRNIWPATNPARVAVLCDLAEENWPSMDLVAGMLCEFLEREHSDSFEITRMSPAFRRRFTRISTSRQLFNADRVLNRFWEYQRWLQPRIADFDLFHIIDHSYSQLVHHLPAERTVVSCHDLDTFRSLLHPELEPRSRLFREMMQHVLNGFRKAALITCDSAAIRDELLAHKLVEPERVRVIPLGIHPTCSPEPDPVADNEASRLIGSPANAINLLHVGSTIPRKRIDVLLRVLGNVRREFPAARLIRVGGPFTADQEKLLRHLNLNDAVVVLPSLAREVLAAVYRQADIVLQPSEAEGFGLPVIEAMACGTPVIASDLPVLREVGGEAASYAPIADISAWTGAVRSLVCEQSEQPNMWSARRTSVLQHARRFSWSKYAEDMSNLYLELLA